MKKKNNSYFSQSTPPEKPISIQNGNTSSQNYLYEDLLQHDFVAQKFTLVHNNGHITSPSCVRFLQQYGKALLHDIHQELIKSITFGKRADTKEIYNFYTTHLLRGIHEEHIELGKVEWMKKLTRTKLTPLLARHFFLQPKKEFREKILSTCISLLNPHLSPEDLTLQFLLECRLFENYIRPQTGNNMVKGAEVVQGLTILFDHLLEAQALEGHMMRGVVHKIAATNTLWISTINPKGKVPFSIPIPPTMTGLQANDLVFYHALETLEGTHYAPIYNPCRLFKEALHVNNIITLSD